MNSRARSASGATAATAALLLCLVPLASAAEPDWPLLSRPELGFGIAMPAVPEHRDNLRDPELFAGVEDFGVGLGDGFLMVSVFTFHPEKRALLGEEEIFRLGEAMVPAGCTVEASRPLPGGPGAVVASDFACADGGTLRYRMHLYGDRFYRLAAGGPRGVAESDAADRFFRSFALIE